MARRAVIARRIATPPPERRCAHIVGMTGRRCRRWTIEGSIHCSSPGHRSQIPGADLALTASVASVQLDGVGWQTWRPGSRDWQAEAWRLYDITGQLRFVANWVGNSVSRCRLYVAEANETGEPGEEVTDPNIAQLAGTPLGKGPAKDEALRLIGVNQFVVGEVYIIAQAGGNLDGSDLWFAVPGRMIRRTGDQVVVRRPRRVGGGDMLFRQGEDLILQVWTEHPADPDEPDSPTRSAIPDLREIEAIRKREFAELDSRLTGAGLLPMPDGIDFPRDPGEPNNLDGFLKLLMRAMGTSLVDRTSAEAMVPIPFTVPGEYLDKIKQVTFWSELSAQLLPLREAAVKSLAQSLDVPAEILLGVGDVNHWTGWLISEDAVSTQIVPILNRIADALTTGYLRGALEAMGEDPDAYVYAFDTSPLTVRPNRSDDALQFHKEMLLSDEAAVQAGAFRTDQMPDPEERVRRLVEQAVLANPALLSNEIVQGVLGISMPELIQAAEPAPQDGGGGQPQEGPPPGGDQGGEDRNPPKQQDSQPAEPPASAPTVPMWSGPAVLAVANMAMLRALSLAGSRLVPHTQRDRWPTTPKHLLYCQVGPVTDDRAQWALRGAWEQLPIVAADLGVDPAEFERRLHGFATDLLTRGLAYEQTLLADLLRGSRLDVAVLV